MVGVNCPPSRAESIKNSCSASQNRDDRAGVLMGRPLQQLTVVPVFNLALSLQGANMLRMQDLRQFHPAFQRGHRMVVNRIPRKVSVITCPHTRDWLLSVAPMRLHYNFKRRTSLVPNLFGSLPRHCTGTIQRLGRTSPCVHQLLSGYSV